MPVASVSILFDKISENGKNSNYERRTWHSERHTVMCCCMLIADCVCVSAAPIVQYCCPLSGQKFLPPWVRLSFHVIYVIKLPTLGVPRPAPPPFRPGNPALCGSHLLVTPYYCRLGDLLCFVFMCPYCIFLLIEYSVFLEYFDAVGWVF